MDETHLTPDHDSPRSPTEGDDAVEHAGDVTVGEGAEAASGGVLGLLDKAVPILVLVALLVHPTQVTLRQLADALAGAAQFGHGLAALVPAANVTISDVILLVAFFPWLLVARRQGRLRQLVQLYPVAVGALLVAALLSAVPFLKSSGRFTGRSFSAGEAVKQILQLCIFFVCAFGVLADYLSRRAWRSRLLAAFGVGACVCVLAGLIEYLQFRPASPEAWRSRAIISAMGVDGAFGFVGQAAGAHEQVGTASNRNVLGAWLTIVLPLAWAVFLFGRRRWLRVGSFALAATGALLLFHGGLWAVALFAVLALSFIRGRTAFAATAVGMLVLFGVAFSFGPQKHGFVLLDSLMMHKKVDRFRTLPLYEIDPQVDRSGRGATLTSESHDPWQQKFIEWQPALQALGHHPLFGVGIGNYQKNISSFYDQPADPDHNPTDCYDIVKARANLMEVDGNPFYRVWLMETGLVGLLTFAWFVVGFLLRAAQTLPRSDADVDLDRALKLGAIVALCAACLGALFTNYWVRGVGTAYVLVLALCVAEPVEKAVFVPPSEEVTRV